MKISLSLVPWLVTAQVFGVVMAWLIDQLTWILRRQTRGFVSAGGPFPIIFLGFLGLGTDLQTFVVVVTVSFLYLCIAAFVQSRQLHERWRIAFWGALLQSWCFVLGCFIGLLGAGYLLALVTSRIKVDFLSPFCLLILSALVTHLLFTFCRPILDLVGRQLAAFIGERTCRNSKSNGKA